MRDFERELAIASAAADAASEAILAIYESAAVHTKPDGSYVTDADYASDRIIRAALSAAFPDDAILTEEGNDDGRRFATERCWIVDPIDGTAAFVERSGDFDIYIALVVDHRPVIALTRQPTSGLVLAAFAGQGAWVIAEGGSKLPLSFGSPGDAIRLGTRKWLGAPDNLPWLNRVASAIGAEATAHFPTDGLNVRSFLQPNPLVDAIVGHSIDGSPLDGWEWDIAAVDLIVREAGGVSTDIDGKPLLFNQPDLRKQSLLLSADPLTHERILTAVEIVGLL